MSTRRPPVAPVALVPAVVTLADVLAVVGQADLPPRRRQDLASAVRTAARAIGREPSLVRAESHLLRRRLAEVAPAAHGLSRQRWHNVRSLLNAAVALLRPAAPGRHRRPFSPEWKALWDRLGSRRLKTALSYFCHFASDTGVDPASVDEAVMERFAAYVATGLLKAPDEALREARRGWNRACREIPDWPGRPLAVPPARTDLFTLPWSAFPASLYTDVRAWLDRLAGLDPFDEKGPARPLRPITLALREYQLRRFASALVHQGRDPTSLQRLADLVELEAFKAGLRYFLERWRERRLKKECLQEERPHEKPPHHIAETAGMLKAVARHWVEVPPKQLAAIAVSVRRLNASNPGMTETNRDRLRALNNPEKVRALLNLPRKLLDLAGCTRQPWRAALLAQDALAIELLLMAPLRISNLVGLDIERHLDRRSGALHLVIRGYEVKNGDPLDYPLPLESTALLDRYLKDFRKRLAPKGSTALFPGRDGSSKDRHSFGQRISRTVRTHTGLEVHPHLFRHIGAKLFLDANPGGYEVVRRVLGHRSMQTTRDFYTGLESPAAVRHFDRTILGLRTDGGP
ncbi:tyrosine recombinase XerC [Siccirubricoccus sp. G192]|uniref:site-specific integrase n=1 Tax=Siccirubricoccus sp. G192 TaxID=2849651 RepID=UPI001C2C24F5|nr:site-specific integrase [Siccirubricoccus sp. G192]MBV1800660.1 site-specific integrase [Siccirubricoccus sp. G192]